MCTLEVVQQWRRTAARRCEGGQVAWNDRGSTGLCVLIDRPLSSITWMFAS